MTNAEFASAWMAADTLEAAAHAVGMSKHSASMKAGRLRKIGYPLPEFSRGPARKHGRRLGHRSVGAVVPNIHPDIVAARVELERAREAWRLASENLKRAQDAHPITFIRF